VYSGATYFYTIKSLEMNSLLWVGEGIHKAIGVVVGLIEEEPNPYAHPSAYTRRTYDPLQQRQNKLRREKALNPKACRAATEACADWSSVVEEFAWRELCEEIVLEQVIKQYAKIKALEKAKAEKAKVESGSFEAWKTNPALVKAWKTERVLLKIVQDGDKAWAIREQARAAKTH
jgi:hypothetical protein